MGGFLDKVYDARTADETRDLYDNWASSYDDEVGANGYATPGRCAAALASLTKNPGAPVLDFGCGTGLSGLALRQAGFTTIDGMDLSADMLTEAREKNIYRSLLQIEADASIPIEPGAYASIAAIGVIGAGAAPIAVMDVLLSTLSPAGMLVFSFNDHALANPVHQDKVDEVTGAGIARLLFQQYGNHLPGQGLRSNVYVLEKA